MFRRAVRLSCALFLFSAAGAPPALIPVNAVWRHRLVPAAPAPDVAWTRPGWDDAGWAAGLAGFTAGQFGYGQLATAVPVPFPQELPLCLQLRHEFTVDDPAALAGLLLRLDFEDGVIAWLNGAEVLRHGVTTNRVVTYHPAGEAVEFDLTPFQPRLRAGTNLLALEIQEAGVAGTSLTAWPELRATFARGPFLQNLASNAVTLAWRTVLSVPGRVRVESPGLPEREHPFAASVTNVALRLADLAAGREYVARVILDVAGREVSGPPLRFRSLPPIGDVDFAVFGDSGGGSAGQHAVAAQLAALTNDFVLHTGDIIYSHFTFGRADLRCLSAYEPAMRRTPFFFALGNHDLYGGDAPFLATFHHPVNDATGTEHFYSFDAGDAHVAVLLQPFLSQYRLAPTNADGTANAQWHWLTNDLAASPKPWKFLVCHAPPFTSGPHRFDNTNLDARRDPLEIAEVILPLASRHGVQVVFNGHDHIYERLGPTNGVTFIVTGGGGAALYGLSERDAISRVFAGINHVVTGRLRGEVLTLEAATPAGQLLDRVEIPQAPDWDDDGLEGAAEGRVGTDPRRADTDADGLPDGWEVDQGLDPLTSAGTDGGAGDADGDGYTNLEEWRAGTGARDPTPTLVLEAWRDGPRLRLAWRTVPGLRYRVESAAPGGPFASEALPGFPRTTAARVESAEVPMPDAARLYRVVEER